MVDFLFKASLILFLAGCSLDANILASREGLTTNGPQDPNGHEGPTSDSPALRGTSAGAIAIREVPSVHGGSWKVSSSAGDWTQGIRHKKNGWTVYTSLQGNLMSF
ncbi:MAG: hypothetical protein KUL82_13025 [Bdellovibrio sp.]|nr:hypothetical protein [Bdellovibrio sp.]